MPGTLRDGISESLGAFRAVLGNRNLRLVEGAGLAAEVGRWLWFVALSVYAFDAGGATAVAVVSLIRIVPSAIAAPFASVLADRFPRQRVMLATTLSRALAFGVVAAGVALSAPTGFVYAMAGVVTLLGTTFRPAEAAIMPSLARSAEELTAANVAASTIVSIGTFVGPALGGILLAATNVQTVFAATGGTFLVATILLLFLRRDERPKPIESPGGMRREVLAGFGTIVGDERLRVLVGLYGAQTLVAGSLMVLIVVMAKDLLGTGDAGVGFLNAAFGLGGFVGVGLTFVLVARQRLASDFAIGMLLWGVPLVLVGLWPSTAAAVAALTVIGVGDVLVEVAAPTLLQRAVPDEVLGRVFGALESVLIGTMGIGSVLAPALVSTVGIRAALIATGVFLPALGVLFWRRLTAIDRAARIPLHEIALLRQIPIFAPLAPPRLEELAARLRPQEVAAGSEVFRQGDPGDRFYVIDAGEVEVRMDGSLVRKQGPGDYFGEIALLHDSPRTATVVAATPLRLYGLEREEFIGAVTGHTDSRAAAETVAGARLATAKPPGFVLE